MARVEGRRKEKNLGGNYLLNLCRWCEVERGEGGGGENEWETIFSAVPALQIKKGKKGKKGKREEEEAAYTLDELLT